MSSLNLPPYIYELLDRIIKANGFNDYSMEIKPGAGEGSGTELLGVDVTQSSLNKKLNIVCKIPTFDENKRKLLPPRINFERETCFYDKIIPMFLKFQEEKNLPKFDQFLAYPKCYGTIKDHDNEQYAIVLEDLRERGFRMWNKFNPTPIENMNLLVRELAKFHGISIAMKDQRPSEFAEYKLLTATTRIFTEQQHIRDFLNVSYDLAIKSLEKEENQRILRDIKENILEYLEYCVNDKTSERFGVLSHGDLWYSNMMFRFNDDEIADEVCILDWQSIRFVSPALDLLTCIFASTDKPLRDKHYMNLIKLYHETLSKTVRMLGSDPDKLFTFEDLQDEMKRCGNYALLFAPAVIAVTTDAMKHTDFGSEQNSSGDMNNESQVRFSELTNGLLEDVNNFGYYRRFSEDELNSYRRA